jgi:hypothetical protein
MRIVKNQKNSFKKMQQTWKTLEPASMSLANAAIGARAMAPAMAAAANYGRIRLKYRVTEGLLAVNEQYLLGNQLSILERWTFEHLVTLLVMDISTLARMARGVAGPKATAITAIKDAITTRNIILIFIYICI